MIDAGAPERNPALPITGEEAASCRRALYNLGAIRPAGGGRAIANAQAAIRALLARVEMVDSPAYAPDGRKTPIERLYALLPPYYYGRVRLICKLNGMQWVEEVAGMTEADWKRYRNVGKGTVGVVETAIRHLLHENTKL